MDKAQKSLEKMADILHKIKALLHENGASMKESKLFTEFSHDTPYQATFTIALD